MSLRRSLKKKKAELSKRLHNVLDKPFDDADESIDDAVEKAKQTVNNRFGRKSNRHPMGSSQTMAPPPGSDTDYSRQAYDQHHSAEQYSVGSYGNQYGQQGAINYRVSYGGSDYRGYAPFGGHYQDPSAQAGQSQSPQPGQGGSHYYQPPTSSPDQLTGNTGTFDGASLSLSALNAPPASSATSGRGLYAALTASQKNTNSGISTSANSNFGTPFSASPHLTGGLPPASPYGASYGGNPGYADSQAGPATPPAHQGLSTGTNNHDRIDWTRLGKKDSKESIRSKSSGNDSWATTPDSTKSV
ncbi:hypothetical protein I302_104799 [Kwoniella bestiolae CBS 10118]|uniref:Uncharacterized protein n=1 Tax=Kwoniella bestiolae CBS 10118 TaxID=1296100 RepID=A0A1B9FRQ4_9TREE|nr:hypothetical protein I302_09132 [Kwoniella bestiolae CBS 10118]OCF21453.1 hypothetical protein I302_09132 [Kwoniella bestiolae CBS 10118]